MVVPDLTKRFIEGLEERSLTYEEVVKHYKYAGGDYEGHYNYYRMLFPTREVPENAEHCVCGQGIKRNCYITNMKRLVIVGNCCIKRFLEKSGRTCEICEAPHKNRKVNKCNDCKNKCEKCKKWKDNNGYKLCYWCYKEDLNEKSGKCEVCSVGIKKCFRYCYNCKVKKEKTI